MNEGQSKKEEKISNTCTQKHNSHYNIILFAAQHAFLERTCIKLPLTVTTFFGKKPLRLYCQFRSCCTDISGRVPYATKNFGDDIVKSDFFY